MSATGEPITILSAHESWNLLAGVALGRLVTSVDGQPEIFPVNSSSSTTLCSSAPQKAPS
jgi:hypothetical protein